MALSNVSSFERNFEKWNIFDKQILGESQIVMSTKTWQGQVEFFTTWLTNRIDWLNKFYSGEVQDYIGDEAQFLF